MIKTLQILIIFLGATNANAAKIVRTGGDALVCEEMRTEVRGDITMSYPTGTKTYLALDTASNSDYRNLVPWTADLSGTEIERARQLIERLRWLDEKRTDRYLAWLNQWEPSIKFENTLFDDIPDSANFAEQLDCEKVQVIIQETEGSNVSYRISSPIWALMDVNNRAFMIVHELIYREAFVYGHQNSFFVAYLNALIASNQVSYMSRMQYYQVLMELGFQ